MAQTSKLEYLKGRLATLHLKGIDEKELGDLALEMLFIRNENETIIDGKYPQSTKVQAQELLKHLRELEKLLVSMYMLSRLEGKKTSHSKALEYMTQKHFRYLVEKR